MYALATLALCDPTMHTENMLSQAVQSHLHLHPACCVHLLKHWLKLLHLVIHTKQAASVQKQDLPSPPFVWILLHILYESVVCLA